MIEIGELGGSLIAGAAAALALGTEASATSGVASNIEAVAAINRRLDLGTGNLTATTDSGSETADQRSHSNRSLGSRRWNQFGLCEYGHADDVQGSIGEPC
jgi:hypothetical protein